MADRLSVIGSGAEGGRKESSSVGDARGFSRITKSVRPAVLAALSGLALAGMAGGGSTGCSPEKISKAEKIGNVLQSMWKDPVYPATWGQTGSSTSPYVVWPDDMNMRGVFANNPTGSGANMWDIKCVKSIDGAQTFQEITLDDSSLVNKINGPWDEMAAALRWDSNNSSWTLYFISVRDGTNDIFESTHFNIDDCAATTEPTKLPSGPSYVNSDSAEEVSVMVDPALNDKIYITTNAGGGGWKAYVADIGVWTKSLVPGIVPTGLQGGIGVWSSFIAVGANGNCNNVGASYDLCFSAGTNFNSYPGIQTAPNDADFQGFPMVDVKGNLWYVSGVPGALKIMRKDPIDCAPGCTASMVGDGNCDAACNVSACTFDNGDCAGTGGSGGVGGAPGGSGGVGAVGGNGGETPTGGSGGIGGVGGAPGGNGGFGAVGGAPGGSGGTGAVGGSGGETPTGGSGGESPTGGSGGTGLEGGGGAGGEGGGGPAECAPGCADDMVGDGNCDDACNVSACSYDAQDCVGPNCAVTVTGAAEIQSCNDQEAVVLATGDGTILYSDKTLTVNDVVSPDGCEFTVTFPKRFALTDGDCGYILEEPPGTSVRYADVIYGTTLGTEFSEKELVIPSELNQRKSEGVVDIIGHRIVHGSHYIYDSAGCDVNNFPSCTPIELNLPNTTRINEIPEGTTLYMRLSDRKFTTNPADFNTAPPPGPGESEDDGGCSIASVDDGVKDTRGNIAPILMALGLAAGLARRRKFVGVEVKKQ